MKSLPLFVTTVSLICLLQGGAHADQETIEVTARANLLTLSPDHQEPVKVFFTYREENYDPSDTRLYEGSIGDASYLLKTPSGEEKRIVPLDMGRTTDRIYTGLTTYQHFDLPQPLQPGVYIIIESGRMHHVADKEMSVTYSSSPATFLISDKTKHLSEFKTLANQQVANHFGFELKDIKWFIRDETPDTRRVAAGLAPSMVPEKFVPIEERRKLEYGGYRVRLEFSPEGNLLSRNFVPMYWHVD